jgi:hypothetical protein
MRQVENAISNFYLKKLIRDMRLSKFDRGNRFGRFTVNKKPPGGGGEPRVRSNISDVDSRLGMFASFAFVCRL